MVNSLLCGAYVGIRSTWYVCMNRMTARVSSVQFVFKLFLSQNTISKTILEVITIEFDPKMLFDIQKFHVPTLRPQSKICLVAASVSPHESDEKG